ncbi:Crp/Fnr family transcriptional regulator [Noviherbaspirillum sp.]|uniref:Crp/Fnr family transcriptional regulator n=1 Tax=Noviherbaspirillum sp. TaxID=1926288 RepID=UPI002FDFE109
MSAYSRAAHHRGNLLLSLLDDADYRQLAPRIERVSLKIKDVVTQRGALPTHVYFPVGSVVSVLAHMVNGAAVEIGTIGREGFLGIEVLAGGNNWTETTICQIDGDALRMRANDFIEAIHGDTPLRRVTQRYMLVYFSQIAQSVACNRLHTIEARFARWVLMTHDRVDGDDFQLTQEFLATMLGVQRPGVSLVASAFQQAGLIRYSRGRMSILDRAELEEACCECYAIVQDQFRKMLGIPDR